MSNPSLSSPFKSPAWKTRAVRHSGVRTRRQIEKKPWRHPEDSSIPFVKHEHPYLNNAPKPHGRRLHLENLT